MPAKDRKKKCLSLWASKGTSARLEGLRVKLAGPTGQKPTWDSVLNWMLDQIYNKKVL